MTKNVFARDLESKCGSRIQDFFMVLDKRGRVTTKGRQYWELDLADCSGQVAARIWNCYEQAGRIFESGHIIELVAQVERYRNAVQLNIERFRRLGADEVELSQLPTGATGKPDEFAILADFPACNGEWIQTDVGAQIALATNLHSKELVERYRKTAPDTHVTPTPPKISSSQNLKQRATDRDRSEELKRKYLGSQSDDTF